MKDCRIVTLYSGSGGNATYVRVADTAILIDAGKSARALVSSLRSLGVEPDTLDAIFITHDHNDHVAALEVLTKKHSVPVHILYKSALRYRDNPPEALCRCFRLYEKAPFATRVGDVTVTAFETPHDSRASVGYRFEFPDGEHTVRIGYATDIGHVTETLRAGLAGCESIVLESNHDVDMLMDGPYPYDLKLRIRGRRGHLSNRECADLAAELSEQGATSFLLAHLSEENNHPDIAFDETNSALAGLGLTLRIASPNAVTMLVGEAETPISKIPAKDLAPEEARP